MATHEWQSPEEKLQLEFWPQIPGLSLNDVRGQVPPAWFEALTPLWDYDLTIWFCAERTDGELMVRYQPAFEGGSRAALHRAADIVAMVSRICGACGKPGRPVKLDRRRVVCKECAKAVRRGLTWPDRVAEFWTADGDRIRPSEPSAQAPAVIRSFRRLETEPSARSLVAPTPPEWTREQLFRAREQLTEALREKLVGEYLITRLAIIGAQWLAARRHTVVTLVGPTGAGKSTAARALCFALKRVAEEMASADRNAIPSTTVDLQQLSEGSAWLGRSIADEISTLVNNARGNLPLAEAGSVLVLDGLDSVASRRRRGIGRDFVNAKQLSLLPLLSGDSLSFGARGGDHLRGAFDSSHSLILVTARLDALDAAPPPARPPSPIDIERQGLVPELANRLGTLLVLPPLTEMEQRRALGLVLEADVDAYQDWGYWLRISEEAIGMVSVALRNQRAGLTLPTAAALLSGAAREALEVLISENAPQGTEWMLTPDAVRLPTETTKPGWRG